MKQLLFKYAKPWFSVYEGETSPPPPPPPPPASPPPPPAQPDDEKPTLSQKQFNTAMAEEKRKSQKLVDDQIKKLQVLEQSKTISDNDRTQLQTRIQELQDSVLTKEQLAEKEKTRLQNEHKTVLDGTTKERDFWKSLFGKETVTRSILDEAVKSEAFNPQQIVALLSSNSRLVEVLDASGNPVPGQFQTKIQMNDTDKDGKPTVLDLTVSEALKRMKDRADEFGNLFKSGVAGGLGQTGGKTGKEIDPSKLSPAEYRKWRNGRLGRKTT